MTQWTMRFLWPFAVVGGLLTIVVPLAARTPTAKTTLVSINRAGTASGNSFSFLPTLSAKGRLVAFVSAASDLVANDTNGTTDIFVRDLKTKTTTLVSVNRTGTASGNSSSTAPTLSANGRFVAFASLASDLVANDTNEEGTSSCVTSKPRRRYW